MTDAMLRAACDITRRLRSSDVFNAPMTVNDTMVSPLALMAADEIERLRGRVAIYEIDAAAAEHEIDRLRAELTDAMLRVKDAPTGLEYRGG